MNQIKKSKITRVVLGVAGFFSFMLGVLIFFSIKSELSESITTPATVIDYELKVNFGEREYQSIL